jgi:hypothetical protein|tara:strand:- start:1785 stop:2024 length:240 start_codon:yes stop_codon:yes gene_type:complete
MINKLNTNKMKTINKLNMMNLISLESVGSVFNTSDNQVYPQLVNGLPDLGMGVDMYDVSNEWISSLSDDDKGKIMKFIK